MGHGFYISPGFMESQKNTPGGPLGKCRGYDFRMDFMLDFIMDFRMNDGFVDGKSLMDRMNLW